MQSFGLIFFFLHIQLWLGFGVGIVECRRLRNDMESSAAIATTIVVDWAGNGDFVTIQSAIDSIPWDNNQWIRIHVRQGVYDEQVKVSGQFIFMEGEGTDNTTIEYDNADDTVMSSTFFVWADNFVAKYITFRNTYNRPTKYERFHEMRQAVAVTVYGDMASFYECSFISLQDTLWDCQGRHYFHNCYIQGAVDFIFGTGQSIYEGCTIKVTADPREMNQGYITAQGRRSPNDPNGFVFRNCVIDGIGKVFLGRAWKAYSRVVFYRSVMSSIIDPQGWDVWFFAGRESDRTYAEYDCTGMGSSMSRRVPWEKKFNDSELNQFVDLSFINGEDWLYRQP